MSAASLDLLSLPTAPPDELCANRYSPYEMPPSAFAVDCLAGLSSEPKSLPCKWLYDDVGSQLFERITVVDEYYPSRTEEALLEQAAVAIAARLTCPTTLVELGSGASRKTRQLLAAVDVLHSYVPIDISADELARACASLRADFPRLSISPLCADFTTPQSLELRGMAGPVLLFFPGSTLGNMAPSQALTFLRTLREAFGQDARLLLGVDLLKDERTLRAAYDDDAGVTAAFNLNLLRRMNRELGSLIDVSAFRHRAVWNGKQSRIEMHLEAMSRQVIELLGRSIMIEAGETIHTENSYKLSPQRWQELFEAAGWQVEQQWQSPQPSFLLALLESDGLSRNDEEETSDMTIEPAKLLESIRKLFAPDHGEDGSKTQFAVAKTPEEWRQSLTPAQHRILREHGTERPGSSPLLKEERTGTYRCAGCGEAVYASGAKFDSGTGWPSFTAPVGDHVETSNDRSMVMSRTEVHCSRCGGHLGHRFADGPGPTGMRHCINGDSLSFDPE